MPPPQAPDQRVDFNSQSTIKNVIQAIKEANINGEELVDLDESTNKEERKREQIGRADQIYNKSKRKWEYFKSVKQGSRKARFTKYVILVRTIWSAKGVPADVEIDIKGSLLQQALTNINEFTRGFALEKGCEQIDHRTLFHSRNGLQRLLSEEKLKDSPDEDMVFELSAGVNFIAQEFASKLTSLEGYLQKRVITFALLWMLFPPNVLAIGHDELNQTFAFFVREVEEAKDQMGGVSLELTVDHLEHDGQNLMKRTELVLKIPGFAGAKDIISLPYYPIDLHPTPDVLKEELLQSSRKIRKFHGTCLADHQGPGLMEGPKSMLIKFNSHGRVMLDPITLKNTNPSNILLSEDLEPFKTADMTDEWAMTVSPKLYGYSLGDKIWGIFAVSNLDDVHWDPNIFTSLVLEQARKDLLYDFVTTHQTGDHDFDDFVRLKGRGLVGLLAGPPGVGKTMTAEAIAEIARRPLYTISSGELGETVESIHTKLKKILELAELWGAVVLLDEADVFLSARNDVDLTRNAIASIFLRELEYFQGVLLLTTNRMKQIDSAFQSRIHFCIQYPDLDSEGRLSIWKSFLARTIAGSKVQVSLNDEDYRKLSDIVLNGRQIKNAMSVSQAVAAKRKQAITFRSIADAIILCQNFEIGDGKMVNGG